MTLLPNRARSRLRPVLLSTVLLFALLVLAIFAALPALSTGPLHITIDEVEFVQQLDLATAPFGYRAAMALGLATVALLALLIVLFALAIGVAAALLALLAGLCVGVLALLVPVALAAAPLLVIVWLWRRVTRRPGVRSATMPA